jgi:ATP-dependent RNA helicase A
MTKIDLNKCFRVGDAACTIASATSFPEPFLHDGKHLRHMHRNLAGNRFSDHVALLNAFQQFEREKYSLDFYYEKFIFILKKS